MGNNTRTEYRNYIEKIKPKPIWNLKYYKDDDKYSDGDVEDEILKIIADNEPEKYTEAIMKHYSWPAFYHLTRTRRNILNWYDFDKDSDVLEIGCGFGAITGMLCDRCSSVTSVELSQRRAMGTLLRCRDKENLEIIVGNLNDIQFSKKFDYITLIGVLEYQGRFTESDNPYRDFLNKIKKLLKPDGKLLIAIENQYGLKYWCGAREDHTGVPFDGMNQYLYTNQGIRTFSKEGLNKLIKESGFGNTYFYYPMPDYKLPTVIYSQDYLPEDDNMQNMSCYYAKDSKTLIAGEKRIYKDIIDNSVFEFFANSFLVECSDSENLGDVIFASLCDERKEEYQIGTKISNDRSVIKFALHDDGIAHLKQTVENEKSIKEHGLLTLGSYMDTDVMRVPYSTDESFEKQFVRTCMTGSIDDAIYLIEKLYEQILKSSDVVSSDNNILYSFLPEMRNDGVDYGLVLKNGYLDMTFRNAFVHDDELVWYDQEWMLENVPADYIIYRALGTLYFSYPEINDYVPMENVIRQCGLEKSWDGLKKIERLFSASVRDGVHLTQRNTYSQVSDEAIVNNIKKIQKRG